MDSALGKALQNLKTGAYKNARMLDGVKEAIKQLSRYGNARRVVLLISESKDRGSESDIGSVIVDALIQGVAVYTANYSAMVTGFTTSSGMQLAQLNRPPDGPPSGVIRDRAVPRAVEDRVNILAGPHEMVRSGAANPSRALAEGRGGQKFSFRTKSGLEAVLDGVVLVSYIRSLREAAWAIVEGAKLRFRPVMMTAGGRPGAVAVHV